MKALGANLYSVWEPQRLSQGGMCGGHTKPHPHEKVWRWKIERGSDGILIGRLGCATKENAPSLSLPTKPPLQWERAW